jgi:hypothetical protein
VKSVIRAKLYAVQSQIEPRKSTRTPDARPHSSCRKPPLSDAERQARYRERLKTTAYLGVADRQTEAELAARELEAKVEAMRFGKRLSEAKPDGSRCLQKGCVFPAVLDGECRAHAQDRRAESSVMPSIHSFLMDHAIAGAFSRVRLPVLIL